MNPRPPMEAPKRRLILDAARKLFIERGYKDTSMDDVAERADVGKGTLYLVSDSKADLFYQVVEDDLTAWAEQIASFVDLRQPAVESLRKMAVYGAMYLSKHPLARDLFAGVHAGVLPQWTERFHELRVRGRVIVEQALLLGIKNGEVDPGIDVPATAAFIQDCTHASYTLYGDEWAADVEAAQKRIMVRFNLWLDGLLKR